LEFVDGRDIRLEDTAERFAHAVIELLLRPDRRSALAEAARAIAQKYDWTDVARDFRDTIIAVAVAQPHNPEAHTTTGSPQFQWEGSPR
jgi:glycosyltransferase involved in cell wall biosynthesis